MLLAERSAAGITNVPEQLVGPGLQRLYRREHQASGAAGPSPDRTSSPAQYRISAPPLFLISWPGVHGARHGLRRWRQHPPHRRPVLQGPPATGRCGRGPPGKLGQRRSTGLARASPTAARATASVTAGPPRPTPAPTRPAGAQAAARHSRTSALGASQRRSRISRHRVRLCAAREDLVAAARDAPGPLAPPAPPVPTAR